LIGHLFNSNQIQDSNALRRLQISIVVQKAGNLIPQVSDLHYRFALISAMSGVSRGLSRGDADGQVPEAM
jgi:hypothetical protein